MSSVVNVQHTNGAAADLRGWRDRLLGRRQPLPDRTLRWPTSSSWVPARPAPGPHFDWPSAMVSGPR